jgi:hypothetical protein
MACIRALAVFVCAAGVAVAGAAHADPTTFAQVSEGSLGDGVTWTNNGAGTGNLNTTTAGGDIVSFQYENVSGLGAGLSGTLTAIETINGGAGASTTALAVQTTALGTTTDYQAFNSPMTISYNLAKPIDGQTNLLTISIVPNAPGENGMIISGANGGTGASSSTSVPTSPAATYTMTFTSAFLNFSLNDPITAGYSYSSLDPMMLIGLDGLLNSFTAEDTGTFSSEIAPLVVPEPASFAILGVGLIGLGAMGRRRLGFSAVC